MTYYVIASRNDGGKEVFPFPSEDKAKEWCNEVGYSNVNYYHLLIITNDGNTLVANIPT